MAPTIVDLGTIVALHEAGHAVACVKLSVPFSSVSIGRARAGPGANVDIEPFVLREADVRRSDLVALRTYMARCRKQVIVCLAGPASEKHAVHSGLTHDVGIGSDLKDLRDARHFVRQLLHTESLLWSAGGQDNSAEQHSNEALPALLVAEIEKLQEEAQGLVAAHFQSICRVARELVSRNRLSACEVERLVAAF